MPTVYFFYPHYAYILVNLLYMHTHTHTIIYALPGFSMMFPHFSIYSCVRGLSFSYLLSNNDKCVCFGSIYILSAMFLWLGEGESYKKTSLFRTSCCDMLSSALSALLPRTRDRSDANLWKRAVLRSVFSLGLPDFQSSQHRREQWTGTKLGEGMNRLF